MAHVIEYQGRLPRSDKRPANPGTYDLQFDLWTASTGGERIWSERIREVEVAPGGFFRVVLGLDEPFGIETFESVPRFLGIRVVRGSRVGEEHGARAPVAGTAVRLAQLLDAVGGNALPPARSEERAELDALPGRLARLKELVSDIAERLEALEEADPSDAVFHRVEQISQRVDGLDGEEGRITHIEDELEDLIGPDGDVVDLNERMDRIEGRAPELIQSLREREAIAGPEQVRNIHRTTTRLEQEFAELNQQVADLTARLEALEGHEVPTADSLGVVKRAGDVMTGGLTINRGGLEVLSGGVTCRGANVTTLEASNLLKTPKLIADAVELRGDFTVDNAHRVVQVRLLEGRQGSARKDGALHLNTRGGAEVVVGNAEEARGLDLHGSLRAQGAELQSNAVALAFEHVGSLEDGELVALVPGGKVARSASAGAAVVGVVTAGPCLLLGGALTGGKVAVAFQGLAVCLADASAGPIEAGDLLIASSTPGHAERGGADPANERVFARAIDGLESGRGAVRVLLGPS